MIFFQIANQTDHVKGLISSTTNTTLNELHSVGESVAEGRVECRQAIKDAVDEAVDHMSNRLDKQEQEMQELRMIANQALDKSKVGKMLFK